MTVWGAMTAPLGRNASGLLLSAVHAGQSGYGGQDEAFQIANVSAFPVVLTDVVRVGEDSGRVVSFPASGITVEAGARIWCARNALAFAAAFGFTPSVEYGLDSTPEVPNLSLDNAFRLPDAGGWLVLWRATEPDACNGDGGPWPAGENEQRGSMERRDPLLPGHDGNWATSVSTTLGVDARGNAILGTPGYTNSARSLSADLVSLSSQSSLTAAPRRCAAGRGDQRGRLGRNAGQPL